jgi:hypothetical protein
MKTFVMAVVAFSVAFAGGWYVLSRATTAAARTIDIPSEESGQHAALCREQWTKRGVLDDRMYTYCVNQEHEGYLRLLDQTSQHGDLPSLQGAVNSAVNEWTKRGMRSDRMVAYEIDKQIDGFLDMKYSEKQPDFNKSVAVQCISQWTKDFQHWSMIKFCYDQQVKPLP